MSISNNPPRPSTLPARFWAKVDKSGDCWIWGGATNGRGYGKIHVAGKKEYVHRLAYTDAIGPIPDGCDIDHRCHVTLCVNPKHLGAVTHKQNSENRRPGTQSNNSSGVRGVIWDKAAGKWRGQLKHEGRYIMCGRHGTIEEATAAVVAKRLELFTNSDLDRVN